MKNFINHSGGAIGSDSAWDEIGKEFGMVNNRHYYYGTKTPKGNYLISKEEFEEGKERVYLANKTLHRKPDPYINLLARNWMQVKNSESVYAIGSIKNNLVDGGTGWAVQMAIDSGRGVYVFDQDKKNWFTWETNFSIAIYTPILTQSFAGIGTREITNDGLQAIRDVYIRTKKDLQDNPQRYQKIFCDDDSDYMFMSFGKYKGKSINAIADDDPEYLMWLLQNMEKLPDTTKRIIKKELKINEKSISNNS